MSDRQDGPETRFLSLKEVAAVIGVSYRKAMDLRKRGVLPQPIDIQGHRRYWTKAVILRWVVRYRFTSRSRRVHVRGGRKHT